MTGKLNFFVVIEKGQLAYSAQAPDLPGCVAAGATVEDAIKKMRFAIEFHLDGIVKVGGLIPNPHALANYVGLKREIPEGTILTGIEAEIPKVD